MEKIEFTVQSILDFIDNNFMDNEIKDCLSAEFEKWYLNPTNNLLRTPINRGDNLNELKVCGYACFQFTLGEQRFEISL